MNLYAATPSSYAADGSQHILHPRWEKPLAEPNARQVGSYRGYDGSFNVDVGLRPKLVSL